MISFSLAVVSDRLQAFSRRLDADPNTPGRLRLFSDPRPASGGLVGSALEVAVLTFPRPSLDNVNGGVLTLRTPTATLIRATTEVTWARFESGNGDYVADCSVGIARPDGTVVIPGEVMVIRDPLPDIPGMPSQPANRVFAGGEIVVRTITMQEA